MKGSINLGEARDTKKKKRNFLVRERQICGSMFERMYGNV